MSAALALGALVAVGGFGLSQTRSADVTETALQEAYADHIKEVGSMLPPHSGPPPFVEISKDPNGGPASAAWVKRFDGSMGVRPHVDPGVSELWQATSTSMTTTEYAGPIWNLPARDSDAVVIGTPTSSCAHLSRDLRFVYSTFRLKLSEVLKGKPKAGFETGKEIVVAQFGGTVLYPSGHEATFLRAHEGFLEPGKQYLLFLWKPIRSDPLYMVSDADLIENGHVFAVSSDSSRHPYDGMLVQELEKKIKHLIAQNANST